MARLMSNQDVPGVEVIIENSIFAPQGRLFAPITVRNFTSIAVRGWVRGPKVGNFHFLV